VLINEPWETSESMPKRVSKDGSDYYTNYTAYPLKQPQETSAISDVVNEATVQGVKYVNAAGVESNEPWEGVNIVVTTYTDGTKTTTKIVR